MNWMKKARKTTFTILTTNKQTNKKKPDSQKTKQTAKTDSNLGNLEQLINIKGFSGINKLYNSRLLLVLNTDNRLLLSITSQIAFFLFASFE